MTPTIYFKIPRRVRFIIIFILVVTLVYVALQFSRVTPREVPPDFLKAREEASVVAKDIVAIANESASNIGKISELDREGKYTEALALINQELERNREARTKAIALSSELEVMAKNLSAIAPASAGQLALQAISSETALISRLISYNDYLVKLLEILQGKFLGKNGGDQIPALIAQINNEAKEINALNQKFNSSMDEFNDL